MITDTTVFDGIKNVPLSEWRPGWGTEEGSRLSLATLTGFVPFLSRGINMRADALAGLPWSIRNKSDDDVWTSDDALPPDDLKWLANLPEVLHRIETSLTVSSTGFLLKERNRMRVLGLRFLSPDTMAAVWDTRNGLTHFERSIVDTRTRFMPDEIVYFWAKGVHETTPRPSPAANAANAAGVLFSMDAYTKAYFDRGAIRATLLTYDGPPPSEADRAKLKGWWQKAVGGIRNAFAAEVVNAAIKPVVIGDGVGDLGNVPLTEEKRQDVGTALGIPLSLLLANAANYATAQADRRNFYELTIIPEADLVARTINEQLLTPIGLSLVFRPEAMGIFQEDENSRAAAFAAYTGGGLKPSVAAQLLGITLPEGIEYIDLDPEPIAASTALPGTDTPTLPASADPEDSGIEDDIDAKRAEVDRLKRWAAKRSNPDVAKFVSDLLSHEEKLHAIGQCSGNHDEAVKAYPVIEWAGEGVDNYRAMKAMVLQLDPDDDEAEQAIRRSLEKKIEAGLNDGFREMIEEVLPDGYIYWKDPSAAADLIRGSWKLNERMEAELRKALYESVSLGVEVSLDMMDQVGMSFDYTMVMDEALEWAKKYSYELIGDLNDSGREIVSRAIARHIEGGKPMGALVDDLMKLYGEQRARMIASTETTRAFFQGQVASLRATGVVETMEWRTSRDHLVCPICGPMHHKRAPLGKMFENNRQPPAHPRCRCWIAPVIDRSKLQ